MFIDWGILALLMAALNYPTSANCPLGPDYMPQILTLSGEYASKGADLDREVKWLDYDTAACNQPPAGATDGDADSTRRAGELAVQSMVMNGFIDDLRAQGFCCASYVPGRGVSCRGKLPDGGYPEEVAIFIPPGFRPKAKAELVLHLHGHLTDGRGKGGRDEIFNDVLAEFRFDRMAAATRRNSIFVVPFSKGKDTTFEQEFGGRRIRGGKPVLTGGDKFPRFLESIDKVLLNTGATSPPAEVESIALTGHSGAYAPIGSVLARDCPGQPCYKDKIKELHLFDSTYGNSDVFSEFARGEGRKFTSTFGPGTYAGNYDTWAGLQAKNEDEAKCRKPYHDVGRADRAACKALFEKDPAFRYAGPNADHWNTVRRFAEVLKP